MCIVIEIVLIGQEGREEGDWREGAENVGGLSLIGCHERNSKFYSQPLLRLGTYKGELRVRVRLR